MDLPIFQRIPSPLNALLKLISYSDAPLPIELMDLGHLYLLGYLVKMVHVLHHGIDRHGI